MIGETYTLPMVALRGLTILPEEVRHFDVSREKSLLAIEEAVKNGQKLFVSAQKDLEIEEPGAEDVYLVGCVVTIRQVVKLPKQKGDSIDNHSMEAVKKALDEAHYK